MRRVRLIRVAALCAAIGISASLGTAGWALGQPGQDQEQDVQQGEDQQPTRRRTARLILPWSALDDLTPRQEATIREIRTDILNQKDELDRIERQRIMEILTEAQKQRVAQIEAERARQQEERRQRDRDQGAATRSSEEDEEE